MSTPLAPTPSESGFDSTQAATSLRSAVPVELIATVLLALSTLVAVTAVSIGIARADVLNARPDAEIAPFAIALFVGLLFAAMGGLTAMMAKPR
jgi:glycerol uptake facilitator-like aquaporin